MFTKPWHYLDNSFANATAGSYKRADTIGLFTKNVLAGVPPGVADLVALKTYFVPEYAAYKAVYEGWTALGGQEKGATQSLKDVEALINTDVNNWEYTIMGTYKKGSAGYTTLFPNGISGLKRGERDERITALNSFSTNLGVVGGFDTVKTAVDARIVQLQNANAAQDDKQGDQKTDSSAVEAARIRLCNALYYVLGGLMMHYADTPDAIAGYFDLEALRAKPQTEFTNSVGAAQSKFIVKRKQAPGDEITLHNMGTAPLTFYFAPYKDTPYVAGMPSKTVAASEHITVPSSDLGASDVNANLIVKNMSSSIVGHWTVAL